MFYPLLCSHLCPLKKKEENLELMEDLCEACEPRHPCAQEGVACVAVIKSDQRRRGGGEGKWVIGPAGQ